MLTRIFLSYRRDDAKWPARQLYETLVTVLPREQVFIDIDSIPPGADFRKVLKGWVNACEILLALIGPGWIEAADRKTGRRRLDDPDDFVRIEIGEGLTRGIPVVPVLLEGTPMPDLHLLPDDVKALVGRQAEFIDYRTFDADVQRLVKRLGLGTTPDAGPAKAANERDANTTSFLDEATRPTGVAEIVIDASRKVPVVGYFWAEWVTSGMQLDVIKKVVESYGSKVHPVSVNVDIGSNVKFVSEVGIRSVPTVCVFRDGRAVDKLEGPKSERQLRGFIDRYVR